MPSPDVSTGRDPGGAAPVPAPRADRGGRKAAGPAAAGPAGDEGTVDRRVGQAREARFRAELRRKAAQDAARQATSARDKALAKGDHVTELEARLLARLERRR